MNIKKIYRTLEKGQRRAALILLIMICIGMGMEMISVGMVLPALELFSGEANGVMSGAFTAFQSVAKRYAGEKSQIFMAGILMATFVARGGIMLFIAWTREKIIADIRTETSKRLLATYMGQGYAFHIGQNSSVLVRNVITEATKFSSLLNQSFIFLADALVVLSLVLLIFLVSPLGTLLTFTMFGIVWAVFFSIVGKKMVRWGKIRQWSDGLRFQHSRQGLEAIKEVKLMGREKAFVEFYQPHNRTSAQMAQYKSFTKGIPRILFETVAVVAIFIIIVLQFIMEQSVVGLVPKLGLFAIAAFRILPSANRLASGYNTLKFGIAVVDLVDKDLCLPKESTYALDSHDVYPIPFCKRIVVQDITFRYAPKERPALSNLSLAINKNETIGIVGESGSGKSTFVDVLLGLLTPESGDILVDGRPIKENLRGWQLHIGYVPQMVVLMDDTLAANIAFGQPEPEINYEKIERAVREANLTELVASDKLGYKMPLGENGVKLSGGQRQRVGIARALYRRPDILVLDEATSALDLGTEKRIVQTLSNMYREKTIIIISHRHSTLQTCDRIFMFENGCLSEENSNIKRKEIRQKNGRITNSSA